MPSLLLWVLDEEFPPRLKDREREKTGGITGEGETDGDGFLL